MGLRVGFVDGLEQMVGLFRRADIEVMGDPSILLSDEGLFCLVLNYFSSEILD